jgi:hypothetical protein
MKKCELFAYSKLIAFIHSHLILQSVHLNDSNAARPFTDSRNCVAVFFSSQ